MAAARRSLRRRVLAVSPRPHFPAARRRYLLCEVVSDDPRCRLSLEDRALGGLIRDTIARVHGTFGAASCSIGFAGARVRGNWAVGGITRERALKGEREGVRATAGASRSDTAPLYGIVLLFLKDFLIYS